VHVQCRVLPSTAPEDEPWPMTRATCIRRRGAWTLLKSGRARGKTTKTSPRRPGRYMCFLAFDRVIRRSGGRCPMGFTYVVKYMSQAQLRLPGVTCPSLGHAGMRPKAYTRLRTPRSSQIRMSDVSRRRAYKANNKIKVNKWLPDRRHVGANNQGDVLVITVCCLLLLCSLPTVAHLYA
jgi:hypothetical protein